MMAARVVVSLALLCAAFLTWRSDHEVRDIESWTASTEVMLAPRADPAQPWTQVNAMWELAESKRNAVEDLREFLEDSAIGVAAVVAPGTNVVTVKVPRRTAQLAARVLDTSILSATDATASTSPSHLLVRIGDTRFEEVTSAARSWQRVWLFLIGFVAVWLVPLVREQCGSQRRQSRAAAAPA